MPNRIIKESICTSESLSSLSDFNENFFYRLIVNCDDYGRMDARLPILKARLYPLRERLTLRDIECALNALADVGCVELYTVDGKPYLHLPAWEVHQTIRAKKSKYPALEDGMKASEIICKQMQANVPVIQSNPIQSEYNPNPIESRADKPPTRTKFIPPTLEEVKVYCLERNNGIDPQRFIDFYSASGWMRGKNKIKDWKACIRTWERGSDNGRTNTIDACGFKPSTGFKAANEG